MLDMNNEQLQQFMALSPMPMWAVDEEQQAVLAVNDAALRLYGYSGAEFLAIPPRQLPLADAMQGDKLQSHRRHDGSLMQIACVQQEIRYHGRPAVIAIVQSVDEAPTGVLAATPSTAPKQTVASTALAGVRILIVDDDPNTREMLTGVLTVYSATVQSAASVHDALQLVQAWRPALVIADVSMPGEDGYDLIKKLRALPTQGGGRTAAICVTGYTSAEHEARALSVGYQAFLGKPLDLDQLLQTAERLCRDRTEP